MRDSESDSAYVSRIEILDFNVNRQYHKASMRSVAQERKERSIACQIGNGIDDELAEVRYEAQTRFNYSVGLFLGCLKTCLLLMLNGNR